MANVVVSAGGTSVVAGFITSGQINTVVSAGAGSSVVAAPSKIGSILQVKGLLDSPTITWATVSNDLRPDVIGLTETSGPTDLVVGAIATTELLQRVGSTIVGIPLSSVGTSDHGALTGLLDNDHPQYIDGSLAFTGDLDMGANAITNVGNMQVTAGSASTVPLVIKAAAAQSANLLEIQDSSAAILAQFDSSGNLDIFGEISVRASGGAAGSEQFGEGASATGVRSLAGGFNASATQEGSIALGDTASATGTFGSMALGDGAGASNLQAVSVGPSCFALGSQSTSLGASANVSASAATGTALGRAAAVTGPRGTAVGEQSDATDDGASFGQLAQATGKRSTAIGAGTGATKDDTISLGKGAQATGAVGCIVIGSGAASTSVHANAVALGFESLTTAAQRVTLGRVGGTSAQLQQLQVSDGFAAFGVAPPGSQPAAIADVAGAADATYSANEVTLINDLRDQLNSALAALRGAGLIAI